MASISDLSDKLAYFISSANDYLVLTNIFFSTPTLLTPKNCIVFTHDKKFSCMKNPKKLDEKQPD
jgi:hypothetical protein